MEIIWTDRLGKEGVLNSVKEEIIIIYTIKEGNLTGLISSYARTAFLSTLLKGR
jgi:hypothetical protein